MPITILILFCIVTEHYHPNTQYRIGLILEVIVIGIVNQGWGQLHA